MFGVFACNLMPPPDDGGDENVQVIGVALDKVTETIKVGETLQLNATVIPSDATNKNVNWSSTDSTILTVNSNGLVTAIAQGSAIVFVTTEDGNHLATCSVVVEPITPDEPNEPVNPPVEPEEPTEPEEGGANVPTATPWIEDTDWSANLREAYLKPYWYSQEIYNETGAIVGEDGEIELMFTPSEIHSIRSYDLKTTYVEGVDYTVEGKKIKRIPSGNLPYWAVEEYYLTAPNNPNVPITLEIEEKYYGQLSGTRYLAYYDGDSTITSKQIAVTYRHQDKYTGSIPQSYEMELSKVLTKINNGEDINVAIYGDSVSVGCNASGTSYGGNITPHMPTAWDLVKEWIESKKDITVNIDSKGTGGWKIEDCVNNYYSRLHGKTDGYDLLILRIGGNDSQTKKGQYNRSMGELLDMFFADYPDASVIIVSPEMPNSQAIGWTGNVPLIESWEEDYIQSYSNGGNCAIAKVYSFAEWTVINGKQTRDWLANNINHSNDFMIRSYAQTILKAMFGTEYANDSALEQTT